MAYYNGKKVLSLVAGGTGSAGLEIIDITGLDTLPEAYQDSEKLKNCLLKDYSYIYHLSYYDGSTDLYFENIDEGTYRYIYIEAGEWTIERTYEAELATKGYVDDAVANAGGAPIVAIYDTLSGETDITTLNITITAEQATEIRKDLEHTILKLYNASSSGLREVYFYYVETKYGNTYYHTIAQGKSYVLTTGMSTGSPNTVTIYELTSGVTEEQLEAKQDKLTAGEGITIEDDGTISATGGSGGGMTGAIPRVSELPTEATSDSPSLVYYNGVIYALVEEEE